MDNTHTIMTRNIFRISSAVCAVAASAMICGNTLHAQCPPMPFDPQAATMISEKGNLMTHCPSMYITDDGEAWIGYYCDRTQQKEDSNMTSIETRLVHFPVDSWRNPDIRRLDFMKCGQKVGGYTQQGRAAYDPALQQVGDKLKVVFIGCEGDEPEVVCRTLNLKNGKLENKVQHCTLSYPGPDGRKVKVDLNRSGVVRCFADLGITDAPTQLHQINVDKKFTRYGEWFYTAIFCWCCPESRPLVVRTKDCISYEYVFHCPEFQYGSTEATIAILDDEFYIQCRTARVEKSRRGTYIGKYSATGECLVKPWRIGITESRPELITKDGKVYAIYNTSPDVKYPDGKKKVNRSHVRISQIDKFAQPRNGWDITSGNSIQYYSVAQHEGRCYIVFIEDRDHMANGARKGNASICELKL